MLQNNQINDQNKILADSQGILCNHVWTCNQYRIEIRICKEDYTKNKSVIKNTVSIMKIN